ncbi:MAG: HPP family protein [Cytophagaceae bacterium]|nr:HPP family protein [Cytophagaceae bacterium]
MSKKNRSYRVARYVMYKQTLVKPIDHFWTFLGAFMGIALIGFAQTYFNKIEPIDNLFLIGSFGASAVLIYGIPNSPLAQPRNLIGGHVISAIVGVSVFKVCSFLPPDLLWLPAALAVSVAIVVMQMSKTLHPPGGATALIATIGSEKIKTLGYSYVLTPVLTGVLIMFAVAMVVNNIPEGRSYPAKR